MNKGAGIEIESGLRSIFESETAAQQGRTPSFTLIQLMARLDERDRIKTRVEQIRMWSEIASVGAAAGLLAWFWHQFASGPAAALPLAPNGPTWAAILGLSASALGLLCCWPEAFSQDP